MKKESQFQHDLIKKIRERFPGSIVMKNDPTYIQGIPDLTVLYRDKWATLECKKTQNAKHQPNQDYYVEEMNKMSFSSFVCPENAEMVIEKMSNYFNKEEDLDDMERSFKGSTRR